MTSASHHLTLPLVPVDVGVGVGIGIAARFDLLGQMNIMNIYTHTNQKMGELKHGFF